MCIVLSSERTPSDNNDSNTGVLSNCPAALAVRYSCPDVIQIRATDFARQDSVRVTFVSSVRLVVPSFVFRLGFDVGDGIVWNYAVQRTFRRSFRNYEYLSLSLPTVCHLTKQIQAVPSTSVWPVVSIGRLSVTWPCRLRQ